MKIILNFKLFPLPGHFGFVMSTEKQARVVLLDYQGKEGLPFRRGGAVGYC